MTKNIVFRAKNTFSFFDANERHFIHLFLRYSLLETLRVFYAREFFRLMKFSGILNIKISIFTRVLTFI